MIGRTESIKALIAPPFSLELEDALLLILDCFILLVMFCGRRWVGTWKSYISPV